MQYTISYTQPNRHIIDIKLDLDDIFEDEVFVQLPAWRPGRYEMANYARNIKRFKIFNENGVEIPFKKVSKDKWFIPTKGTSSISIHYNYYAFTMDAGNSFLDESQLYINFINCLIYEEKRQKDRCLVYLKIPEDYKIACGLKEIETHVLEAADYFRLVDSPMIASNLLKKLNYSSGNCQFYLWIMGEVNLSDERVLKDFKAFTECQIATMKGFPHSDYHFIFQILPYKHYHGVEHFNSTVITIGPSEKLNSVELYNNFLGVSSHELFHAWNVIRIRPAEMMPYDFSKENYFTTGFVAEGFTTYYGDLFLVRSGVYSKPKYLHELNVIISRHFDNHGRFNLSLADSSFDLWLDGYSAGIPNRKVSIYVKGAVVALMLDLELRKSSDNLISLDDVIRVLWTNFGEKNIGYTIDDVKNIIESISTIRGNQFFDNYIFGTLPEEQRLDELLKFVGCRLYVKEVQSYENNFGFKITGTDGSTKVSAIEPGSIAEKLLSIDDELIAVNSRKIENNLADLIANQKEVELTLFRNHTLNQVVLENDGKSYWKNYVIGYNQDATDSEKENFNLWLNCHRKILINVIKRHSN